MDTVTIVYLPETDGVPVTYTGSLEKVMNFLERHKMGPFEYFAFEGQPIKLPMAAKKARRR